jgi:large subunit ribosomal protein L24
MVNIKKGDTVQVIGGRGRKGKAHSSDPATDTALRGEVIRVLPQAQRVVVHGVNMVKKHQRPRPTGGRSQTRSGIIEFEAPIHMSNVMLVCPHCGQPTRVGRRRDETGHVVRVCKRDGCGNVIA